MLKLRQLASAEAIHVSTLCSLKKLPDFPISRPLKNKFSKNALWVTVGIALFKRPSLKSPRSRSQYWTKITLRAL